MSIPRILIVGAGLTGSALARRLAGAPVSLTCWDKASRPGGRMTTKVFGDMKVDIGPKFISRKPDDIEDSIFTELIEKNLIQPVTYDLHQSHSVHTNTRNTPAPVQIKLSTLEKEIEKELEKEANQTTTTLNEENLEPVGQDSNCWLEGDEQDCTVLVKTDNYTATFGSQAIVEYLLKRSTVKPETKTFLNELNAVGPQNSSGVVWEAQNHGRNLKASFDAVILTIPVPQFLGTSSAVGRPLGNYLSLLQQDQEVYNNLEKVTYSTSFSLGVFYSKSCTPLEEIRQQKVKYYPGNDIIKYISVECEDEGGPVSVCVHSHRTWAQQNTELTKEIAKDIIYKELENLLSPDDSLPEPLQTMCHKWRYSQTSVPFQGVPGAVTLVQEPLLIGAGDSFSISNVGGCLDAARVAQDILKQRFNF